MCLSDVENVLRNNLNNESMSWLEQKSDLIRKEKGGLQLNFSFSNVPRFIEKKALRLSGVGGSAIEENLPGIQLDDWTTDRLARVWLLMQVPDQDQSSYVTKINGLFSAPEMNELVALYSALPVLRYPEEWVNRCEEGIRSNIGTVLEAIMYHNPYPEKHLSENAWNQLVLKAFFTEKDVTKISGLQERNNTALKETLKDYVQERLAAHRNVHPEIYKLIGQENQI